MVQMVMANILYPLTESPGLSPNHSEYCYMGHIKDKDPENQEWGKDRDNGIKVSPIAVDCQ
jgi:hypothetical protein